MKQQPLTPELRTYLLDLIREERSLEQLYRMGHDIDELRKIRSEWRAAYRRIRKALVAQADHSSQHARMPQSRAAIPLSNGADANDFSSSTDLTNFASNLSF